MNCPFKRTCPLRMQARLFRAPYETDEPICLFFAVMSVNPLNVLFTISSGGIRGLRGELGALLLVQIKKGGGGSPPSTEPLTCFVDPDIVLK